MNANDREAQLTLRASAVDKELKALRMEIEKIHLALIELNRVKQSLENTVKGAEVLMPIGKFAMVRSQLLSDKLLINVGGQYFVEMSPDEARKKIDEYIEETQQYHDRLEKRVKEAEKELISILKEARSLESR